jgi:hypothetical protein
MPEDRNIMLKTENKLKMYRETTDMVCEMCDNKVTTVSVQAWTFREGSWGLRLPACEKIDT